MISLDEYWMGRDTEYPPSDEQVRCAQDLIERINMLEVDFGSPLTLTSGYRPPEITDTIPHAVHGDAHEKCEGIDIHDPEGVLAQWCLSNQDTLAELGLWMESPQSAVNHVHLQSYSPKSGRRVFIA